MNTEYLCMGLIAGVGIKMLLPLVIEGEIIKPSLKRAIKKTWGVTIEEEIFYEIDLFDNDAIREGIVDFYYEYGELNKESIHIKDDGFRKTVTIDGATNSMVFFYNDIGYYEDKIKSECKEILNEVEGSKAEVNSALQVELNHYFERCLNLYYVRGAKYNRDTNVVTLDYKYKKWDIALNK